MVFCMGHLSHLKWDYRTYVDFHSSASIEQHRPPLLPSVAENSALTLTLEDDTDIRGRVVLHAR